MAETKTNSEENLNRPELAGLDNVVDIRSAIQSSVEGALDETDYLEQEWLEEAGDLGGGALVGEARRETSRRVEQTLQAPANNTRWLVDPSTLAPHPQSRVDSGWFADVVREDQKYKETRERVDLARVRSIQEQVAKATKKQLIDIAYNPKYDEMVQDAARHELSFRRKGAA